MFVAGSISHILSTEWVLLVFSISIVHTDLFPLLNNILEWRKATLCKLKTTWMRFVTRRSRNPWKQEIKWWCSFTREKIPSKLLRNCWRSHKLKTRHVRFLIISLIVLIAFIELFAVDKEPRFKLAMDAVSKSRNRELQQLFPHGFSMHHAGMLRSDRNIVERNFSDGLIRVLYLLFCHLHHIFIIC